MRFTSFISHIFAFLGAVIMLLLIVSCSGTRPIEPTRETVQDGIEIIVQADSRLNFYEGKANPLKLVVYQLETSDTYYRYSDSEENLSKLLHIAESDPEAINPSEYINAKDYFIQPGQAMSVHLPRFSPTRWVVIVAGYWRPLPNQASRIFAIPIKTNKGIIFLKKPQASVQRLEVRLKLGATRIEEVSSNNGTR